MNKSPNTAGLYRAPLKGSKRMTGKVTLRVDEEKQNALRSIPNWTDKLRAAIDRLIEEEKEN